MRCFLTPMAKIGDCQVELLAVPLLAFGHHSFEPIKVSNRAKATVDCALRPCSLSLGATLVPFVVRNVDWMRVTL